MDDQPTPEDGRKPILHHQAVNITSTTSVSIAGTAYTIWGWFHKFFKGRSETVVERKNENATSLTVTRVTMLSKAHNYFDDAQAYFSAAKAISDDPSHLSPKYFLLSHAIELALKAYILGKSGDAKTRHDLNKALDRAVALGLQPADDLKDVVHRVAPAHDDYDFRYTDKSWTHLLPSADRFEATIAELIKQVEAMLADDPAILRIS